MCFSVVSEARYFIIKLLMSQETFGRKLTLQWRRNNSSPSLRRLFATKCLQGICVAIISYINKLWLCRNKEKIFWLATRSFYMNISARSLTNRIYLNDSNIITPSYAEPLHIKSIYKKNKKNFVLKVPKAFARNVQLFPTDTRPRIDVVPTWQCKDMS